MSRKELLKRVGCGCPEGPSRAHAIGRFRRSSDRKWVRRYRCVQCKRSFSEATATLEFRQQKRQINPLVEQLLCSGVSLRRSARILCVDRSTIARRLPFLSLRASLWQEDFLKLFTPGPEVQFDEMESSEHTKLKPLSIPLLVDKQTRKILAFDVVSMPAKGRLAAVSRRKYGLRPDLRAAGIHELLLQMKPILKQSTVIRSDDCPRYPHLIARHLPELEHLTCLGGRGCISGQGELKRKVYDPLFSLNHTAAMLRANVNRLFRRTWCISKKAENLKHHIRIYVRYHNEILTA